MSIKIFKWVFPTILMSLPRRSYTVELYSSLSEATKMTSGEVVDDIDILSEIEGEGEISLEF